MSYGGVIAIAALLVWPVSGQAIYVAPTPEPLERISGEHRAATAAELSKVMHPDDHMSPYAVLVSKENHADALAAGPMAAMKGAPLLVTAQDSLDGVTATELDRVLKTNLGVLSLRPGTGGTTTPAAKVIIVGGESAISADVEQAVKDIRADIETMRIFGTDRFSTAVEVAKFMDSIRGYSSKWAFVANGEAYPDAMAAASVGSDKLVCPDFMPILLTRDTELPQVTADYLSSVAITGAMAIPPAPMLEKIFALGGLTRISQEVFDAIDALVGEEVRIAGDDRYMTATEIANTFYGAGNEPDLIGVTRGDYWADALAAGPFFGKKHVPTLLVEPELLPDETYNYVLGYKDVIMGGWVVGGLDAVSDGVKASVEDVYINQ